MGLRGVRREVSVLKFSTIQERIDGGPQAVKLMGIVDL